MKTEIVKNELFYILTAKEYAMIDELFRTIEAQEKSTEGVFIKILNIAVRDIRRELKEK